MTTLYVWPPLPCHSQKLMSMSASNSNPTPQNTGQFAQSKRIGIFRVVDANGVFWTEKYDEMGKRTARKKVVAWLAARLLPLVGWFLVLSHTHMLFPTILSHFLSPFAYVPLLFLTLYIYILLPLRHIVATCLLSNIPPASPMPLYTAGPGKKAEPGHKGLR